MTARDVNPWSAPAALAFIGADAAGQEFAQVGGKVYSVHLYEFESQMPVLDDATSARAYSGCVRFIEVDGSPPVGPGSSVSTMLAAMNRQAALWLAEVVAARRLRDAVDGWTDGCGCCSDHSVGESRAPVPAIAEYDLIRAQNEALERGPSPPEQPRIIIP